MTGSSSSRPGEPAAVGRVRRHADRRRPLPARPLPRHDRRARRSAGEGIGVQVRRVVVDADPPPPDRPSPARRRQRRLRAAARSPDTAPTSCTSASGSWGCSRSAISSTTGPRPCAPSARGAWSSIHWDDFFRPLHQPLRALPYAGDDLDVSMRVLTRLASEDGLPLHLPTLGNAPTRGADVWRSSRWPWSWHSRCSGRGVGPRRSRPIPAAGLLIAVGVVSVDDALAEVKDLLPVVGFLAAVLVLGEAVRRRGPVPRRGGRDGPAKRGRTAATDGNRVRHRRDHDGSPEPRRDRRAVDTGRVGDRADARHLVPAACLCHRPSGQHGVASAAGVQPDQPAGLHRRGADLRPLQRRHGPAVATRHRGRVSPPAVFFRRELAGNARGRATPPAAEMPVFVLVVLATDAGWASRSTSLFGVAPAWAALAGAVVLGVRGLLRRRTTLPRIALSANVRFLAFVLCLGVVVTAVMRHGLDDAVRHVLAARRRRCPPCSASPSAAALLVQRRQQPARRAGAPAAGRRCWDPPRCWPCWSASTSGRTSPTRGRYRTCCGAAWFNASGPPRRLRRVQPRRPVHRASDAGRRGARPVGRASALSGSDGPQVLWPRRR